MVRSTSRYFNYHSQNSIYLIDTEMADDVLEVHWINCTFCQGRERRQRLSFSILNFETVFKNSTPEKITTFVRIERGIRAAKFEAARIHLFKWRFRSSGRRFRLSSLIAGNSALLPSVVIDFSMILAGNSFIVRCHVTSKYSEWGRALLGKNFQQNNKTIYIEFPI